MLPRGNLSLTQPSPPSGGRGLGVARLKSSVTPDEVPRTEIRGP